MTTFPTFLARLYQAYRENAVSFAHFVELEEHLLRQQYRAMPNYKRFYWRRMLDSGRILTHTHSNQAFDDFWAAVIAVFPHFEREVRHYDYMAHR